MPGEVPGQEVQANPSNNVALEVRADALERLRRIEEQWQWYASPGRKDASPQGMTLSEAIQSGREHLVNSRPDLAVASYDLAMHLSGNQPLSLRLEMSLAQELLGVYGESYLNLTFGALEYDLEDPDLLPRMDKALAAAFEMMLIDNRYLCTLQCRRDVIAAEQLAARMDDLLEELLVPEENELEDQVFSTFLAMICYLRAYWRFQVNLKEQHVGPGDAKAFDTRIEQRIRNLEAAIRKRKWTVDTALLSVVIRDLPFHDRTNVTQRNHLLDSERMSAQLEHLHMEVASSQLPIRQEGGLGAMIDESYLPSSTSTVDVLAQIKAFDDPDPFQFQNISGQLTTSTEDRWYVKLAFIIRHLAITTNRRLPAYMHCMIQDVFDFDDPHLDDVVDILRRIDRILLHHMGDPRLLQETLDARELRDALQPRHGSGLTGKVISEGTTQYAGLGDCDCDVLKAGISLSIARALTSNPAHLTDNWHVRYAIDWVDAAERLLPHSLPELRNEAMSLRMEVNLVHRPLTAEVRPFVEETLAVIESDCLSADTNVVDRAIRRAMHLINLCFPLSHAEEFPDRRRLWICEALRILGSKEDAMSDDVRELYQAFKKRLEKPDARRFDDIQLAKPKSVEECGKLVLRLEGDLEKEMSVQAHAGHQDDRASQDRVKKLRRDIATCLMEQQSLLFGEERADALRKAANHYEALEELVRRSGSFDEVVGLTTSRMVAEWTAFKQGVPPFDAERVLGICRVLEEYLDGTRKDSQISLDVDENTVPGLGGLLAQQSAAGQIRGRILSTVYLDVAIRSNKLTLAWEWQQKIKARSVTERMLSGTVSEIPVTIRRRLDKDSTAASMLIDEERLAKLADRTMGVRPRLAVLKQLREHRSRMRRESPLLAELLDVRDGRPQGLSSLRADFKGENEIRQYLTPAATVLESAPSIWLIDWLMWPYIRPTLIVLVMIPLTGLLPIRKVTVWGPYVPEGPGSLEKWMERFWEDGKYEGTLSGHSQGSSNFKNLDKLVEPIGRLANPDDTLVLSPTGMLNSLPLHALIVNGRPLISRHKIVYAANATIFSRCVTRSLERSREPPSALTGRVSVASVYEPDPQPPAFSHEFEDLKHNQTAFRQTQGEIRSNTEQVAMTLGAKHMWSGAVTRESFREMLKTSKLAVYYGHCDQSQDEDILKQSLRLFDGPFQVTDLLNTPLPGSTLLLIACGSSTQHISAADEPLGLVTAGLIAGAASIVGTLWPVHYESAMYFLNKFVEHLKKQANDAAVRALATRGPNRGKVMLSLATALQFATLEVKKRYVEPYHWAAYVLHGSPVAESPFGLVSILR